MAHIVDPNTFQEQSPSQGGVGRGIVDPDAPPVDKGDILQHLYDTPGIGAVINAGVSAGQSLNEAITNAVNIIPGVHLRSPVVTDPNRPISTAVGRVAAAVPEMIGAEAIAPELFAARAVTGATRMARLGERAKAIAKPAAALGAYGAVTAPGDVGQRLKTGAEVAGTTGALGAGAAALRVPTLAAKALAKRGASRAAREIKGRLTDLLTRLKGKSTAETAANDLFDIQSKYYDEVRTPSTDTQDGIDRLYTRDKVEKGTLPADLFKKAETQAKEKGIKGIDRKAYQSIIAKEMRKIDQAGSEFVGTPAFGEFQAAKNYLQEQFGLSKREKHIPFEGVTQLKNKIGRAFESLPYGHILRKSFHNIKEGIENLRDEAMGGIPSWRIARDKWNEEIVPFRRLHDKVETPFHKRYKATNKELRDLPISKMGSEYIRPGVEKDQHELIQNLFKTLPNKESKDLAAYNYLKSAEDTRGNADVGKLLNLYGKLGKKQRKLLFPDDHKELSRMFEVRKTNPKAFKEVPVEGVKEKIGLPGVIKSLGLMGGGVTAGYMGHPGYEALGLAAGAYPWAKEAIMRQLSTTPQAGKAFLREVGLLPKKEKEELLSSLAKLRKPARAGVRAGTLAAYRGGQ
jgi:hypothetical protein